MCISLRFWWTRGDSNPRPPRCERGALPAELLAHRFSQCKLLYNIQLHAASWDTWDTQMANLSGV